MSIISKLPEDIVKEVLLPLIKEEKKVIPLKFKMDGNCFGYKIYPHNTGYKAEFYVRKHHRRNEENKNYTERLYENYKSLYFKNKHLLFLWVKLYTEDSDDSIEYELKYRNSGIYIMGLKPKIMEVLKDLIDLVGEVLYVE